MINLHKYLSEHPISAAVYFNADLYVTIKLPNQCTHKKHTIIKKSPDEFRRGSTFGAGNVTRTRDLLITNQLLYQLSYSSIFVNLDIILESSDNVKI